MNKELFLKEYEELCIKHGLCLGGCGCCGSPFLKDVKEGESLDFDENYDNVVFYKEEK